MVDNSSKKIKRNIMILVLFSDLMYLSSYMTLGLAVLQLSYGDYSYFKFALIMTIIFKVIYVISKRTASLLNEVLKEKTSQYIAF